MSRKRRDETRCKFCGEWIRIRWINGQRVPLHRQGACSALFTESDLGKATPAKCKSCGGKVYFIQHNGGSFYTDDLGKPWLKHPCYMSPPQAKPPVKVVPPAPKPVINAPGPVTPVRLPPPPAVYCAFPTPSGSQSSLPALSPQEPRERQQAALNDHVRKLLIHAPTGHTVTIDAGQLLSLPVKKISYPFDGIPAQFEGVVLVDVIASFWKQASHIRASGSWARTYVIAESQKRERALFSWAELDPVMTSNQVFVLLRMAGRPLPPPANPFILFTPQDQMKHRCLEQFHALWIKCL